MSVQRVEATVTGARGAGERLGRVSRAIQPVLYQEMATDLGSHAADIYRGVAPRRSGRLARTIRSVVVGAGDPSMQVQSTVADPKTGFRYTRVTRIGHFVSRIFAKAGGTLRFTIGGRVLFRKSVRGYHPSRDWAAGGHPAAEAEVAAAAYRVGRRLGEIA